ncbi:uncharacterized protein BKCO1_6100052 [Diplodia corticola]|uniref:Uncharacterized protein n=1 Tax=Diplodia corticola TaxID=236234 RepID=A0A1J9RD03_9PEZI|nr:uncharacterized protein BKCO1_6100052 [Diplodia corticola]OJD30403.1 hypothetical protein BKCO1_6100052 [Diplodia corticola]
MRARMDPLAQSPLGSIWTSVMRRDFERNIDDLDDKHVVLEPRDYTGRDFSHEKDAIAALPLDLERKLADDFAYISAYDVGVNDITAATIECSLDSPGITVRLAANEGVEDCVQNSIKEVLQILKGCGRKLSHRERSEENILSIVVRLNQNRIYSRLRSRHQQKRVKGQSDRLLSLDFRNFVGQQAAQTRNNPQELMALQGDLAEFDRLVDQLENGQDSEPMEELKRIVKKAWLISDEKIGIQHRLKRLGVLSDRIDNSTVRAIDKLANYWRICRDLVRIRLTREYRHLFDDPRLEAIENYRAHGWFSVSKAHRQVKNIWTVPERKDYSIESLERIRRSIVAVDGEVYEEAARKQRQRRTYPMQSSINLKSIAVISPSMSSDTASILELAEKLSISTVRLHSINRLLRVYHQANAILAQCLYRAAGYTARHGIGWHTYTVQSWANSYGRSGNCKDEWRLPRYGK